MTASTRNPTIGSRPIRRPLDRIGEDIVGQAMAMSAAANRISTAGPPVPGRLDTVMPRPVTETQGSSEEMPTPTLAIIRIQKFGFGVDRPRTSAPIGVEAGGRNDAATAGAAGPGAGAGDSGAGGAGVGAGGAGGACRGSTQAVPFQWSSRIQRAPSQYRVILGFEVSGYQPDCAVMSSSP